jgi:PPOX class probable F420-dependent enzyme
MSPRVGDPEVRFGAARVARLATTTTEGVPHLVPVVFALVGETVWSAVDAKPKSTTALRRLDNVRANPSVTVLVDHYDDDWSTLWWVRADGTATVLDVDGAADGIAALVAKYPQYQRTPPPGPVLRIEVSRWVSWSAR